MRAVVCAGDQETEYLRAGRGDVVVLLLEEHDGRGALELIAMLSAAFLVIVPRVPRQIDEETLGTWLSNVADGLGIGQFSIVAESPFIVGAMQFSTTGDDRVRRLALLAARPDAADAARFLNERAATTAAVNVVPAQPQ